MKNCFQSPRTALKNSDAKPATTQNLKLIHFGSLMIALVLLFGMVFGSPGNVAQGGSAIVSNSAFGQVDRYGLGIQSGAHMQSANNVDNDPGDTEIIVADPNLPLGQSIGIDLDGDGDIDIVRVGTQDGAHVQGSGNVDNDPGDTEIIVKDPTLPLGQSAGVDLDGDGDIDIVRVGTQDGARIHGTDNVDNDPDDTEVIVNDPTLPLGQSAGIDLDGDGDIDIIRVGTFDEARIQGSVNVDNDPDDTEIIVKDPTLPLGQSIGMDLDGDGDIDIVRVGTQDGALIQGTDNVDNDPDDDEVIVKDPTLPLGQSIGIDLDGDGDIDIVRVGTQDGAIIHGTDNVDNDPDNGEVVVEDPSLPLGQSIGIDVDGDGDIDIIIIGTSEGARILGSDNVDNDPDDTEIIVEDPNLPLGQSIGIDVDGDGDIDIVRVGTYNGAHFQDTGNVDNDPNDTEIIVQDPTLSPGQSIGIDLDGDGDDDIIRVGYAMLSLIKTVNDSTPALTRVITYTIVVENSGILTATNAVISDALPDGLALAGPVTLDPPDAGVTGTLPILASDLTILAGGSVSVTFAVSVSADLEIGAAITNVASITCTEMITPQASSNVIIVQGTELRLTKEADDTTPGLDQRMVYVIRVENSGPADATDAVISDNLPDGLTFAGPVVINPPHPEATETQVADDLPVLVSGLTLSVGEYITVALPVTVNTGLTNGTVIFNSAAITGAETPSPKTDSCAITVRAPDFTLTKSVDDDNPQVGQRINYTIVVENSGEQEATEAVVSDPLHSALSFAGPITLDPPGAGTPGTAPPILASDLTIMVGERITLTFPVTLNTSLTGGTPPIDIPDGMIIPNTAQVTSTQVTMPVTGLKEIVARAPDLILSKDVDDDTPALDQEIVYTIVVNNDGTGDANHAVISDTLRDGLTFVEGSVELEIGGMVVNPGSSPPTLAEDLFIGSGESVTLTFGAVVSGDIDTIGTVIFNTASVTSTEVATPVTNINGPTPITVQGADLRLSKEPDDPRPNPGQLLVYTIVIENPGPTDVTQAVISDTLSNALTFAGPVTLEPDHPEATVAQDSYDFPTLLFGLTLLDGDTITITLPVMVNTGLPDGTEIYNIVGISSPEVPSPQTNPDPQPIIIKDTLPPTFPTVGTILITPTGGIQVLTRRPFFDWVSANDNGTVVSYTLILTGTAVQYSLVAFESTYTPIADLTLGPYSWTVIAHDVAGHSSEPVHPAETFMIKSPLYLPLILKSHPNPPGG